jgi:hypothetical protein
MCCAFAISSASLYGKLLTKLVTRKCKETRSDVGLLGGRRGDPNTTDECGMQYDPGPGGRTRVEGLRGQA